MSLDLFNYRWVNKANHLGSKRIPFLFIVDFERQQPLIYSLDEVPDHIFYNFNGVSNRQGQNTSTPAFELEKFPLHFKDYKKGFDLVSEEIHKGNSFLLNLSYPTKIITSLSLKEIYDNSIAKYKLNFRDQWVVFSPESFVKIKANKIYAYPMKGTINADLPNAAQRILADYKETAEHNTIIDLIRNDLSQVAKKVRVSKYRYLDKIKTHQNSILQVSSEIEGNLPVDYHRNIGTILASLLPAGSISGAPKKKTIEIIEKAEGQKRGYYTGIAGIYDGNDLDSCVLIRFIENARGEKYFRSGGGITHLSKAESEYQELIDKVYVPIRRNHPDPSRKGEKYKVPQSSV